MTNKEIKSALIKLAAEMVRCEGMPSPFVDDWLHLPKMSKQAMRSVFTEFQKTNIRAKDWGYRLTQIVIEMEE